MSTMTTTQAAEHYGVDPATVRRWAESGKVAATKTPGGQWRIAPESAADRHAALSDAYVAPAPRIAQSAGSRARNRT